jgi:hypothetical protein
MNSLIKIEQSTNVENCKMRDPREKLPNEIPRETFFLQEMSKLLTLRKFKQIAKKMQNVKNGMTKHAMPVVAGQCRSIGDQECVKDN